MSGETAATFFPVAYSDGALSSNDAINSQLFSTAKFLRDYLQYRNRLAQQNKPWFLGSDNQLITGDLPSVLQSEVFQLNIVKAELTDSSSLSLISQMQSSLSKMAAMASDLSQKIGLAVSAESGFTNEPDSKKLNEIPESFSNAFSVLYALESDARAYGSLVLQLKNKISTDTSLSVEEKSQFVSFADSPQELSVIGSKGIGDWVILSQETEQSVQRLFADAKSKSFLDSAKLELEKRIQRNAAFSAVFSADPVFLKSTGYPSLKIALDDLQSPQNRPYWKNQEQVGMAIQQFDAAVRLLDGEEFELSLVASQKAKRAVELAKKDGFLEEETDSLDTNALINIAIVVLLGLIVLFFLKNRQKIVGAIVSESGSNETDLYAWQRK